MEWIAGREARRWRERRCAHGVTLAEFLMGAVILAIAIGALLGAFVGQLTVSEHARNLTWATNDAARVMEQLREQNSGSGCSTPSVAAPTGFASWDAWLLDTTTSGGGGESIGGPNELVVVTPVGTDPLQVTVAVCWRHRKRTIGECTWNGTVLSPNPGAGGNPAVTESPAMLSTLMTCRK